MKVCWLSNYYSPYKIKLFEEINKQIELTAVFLPGTDDKHRNNEWVLNDDISFKYYIIDSNYKNKIKQLAKENDVFIDAMYSTKYGIYAVNEFKKHKKTVLMYADGGIAIDRGILVNGILSFIINRHDYCFSSGPHCDRYYHFYKVPDNKLKHFKFTSLTNQDIKLNFDLRKNKANLRKQLNIDGKFTLISVGKPIKGKGFDVLLNSYLKTGLASKINLLIVGGEPRDDIKEIVINNNLKNVQFIGLINSDALKQYYAVSDAFILCTKTDVWGLVINEALSFGLPVITSNNCGAGVHFNLQSNCVTTCDINDVNSYSKQITKLYNDNKLLNQLSNKSLEIIKDYTIENSALDIINCLNKL